MCIGQQQQPQAPQIIYRGPSEEDLQRDKEALDKFTSDLTAQNDAFQADFQDQLDEGNEALAALTEKFNDNAASLTAAGEKDAKAAQAQGGAMVSAANATQNAAYTVETATETLDDSQTTEEIQKKEKKKPNLTISTAGTSSEKGAGVNLGI